MENKDHALRAVVGAQSRGPPEAGETETSASGPTLGIRTVPGWAVDGRRGRGDEMAQACSLGMVWSTLHGRGARGLSARWAVPPYWLGQALGLCSDRDLRDHRVVELGGALQGGLCAGPLLPQQGLDVAWGAGGECAQFCDRLNPGIAKLGW